MSWHFSRALVAEYSESTCSDGKQSALLSANPTQQAFLCKDRMTAFSRLSRFGMTFAPLTENLGVDLLTWFLADSRVRTYQLLGMVPVSTASAPDCGEKWRESSVRYDLDSSSWKTAHCLLSEDLPWSSVILPKWGMAVDGALLVRTTPTLRTKETGYGFLPTPTASNTKAHHMRGADKGRPRKARSYGAVGPLNPQFVEWLMGWPDKWTELKPLEMDKFREWQRQHSEC